jgi:site-specific DNA-methyltransferase (adenine-specific)
LRRDYEELRRDYEELRRDYEELRRPFNLPERSTDVLQFPQDSGASKHYGHDTVKGEAITSYLIQVTTRPGALVVVPFAGSGTECAMAAKLGRRFVGYEIDPKYAETSNKRVKKYLGTQMLL